MSLGWAQLCVWLRAVAECAGQSPGDRGIQDEQRWPSQWEKGHRHGNRGCKWSSKGVGPRVQ